MTYTTETKIKAIERELKMRRKVYPGRIAASKMTQAKADHEIAVMESILEDYRRQLPEQTEMF